VASAQQHPSLSRLAAVRTSHAASPRKTFLAWTLGASLAAVGGCFIEPAPPTNFRHDCDADAECIADEDRCIAGLCQRPCTAATSKVDCPSEDGYALCLNGTCASVCSTDKDSCPDPQQCLPPPEGLGATGQNPSVGFCGQACDAEMQTGCPEREFCIDGYCLALPDEETGT